ncbi:MAG: hypothetical protein J6R61_03420 [Bacteroidales bacterium]|nr:hypothetical protein [Bacteroidales bacterium]
MKKFILFLIFAIAGIGVAAAQNYQEVVYLKNGSVIRGVIIEQIPNQSVKIQTSDGNIFVYQISEVEKITKEQAMAPTRQRYTNNYVPRERVARAPKERAYRQDAFLPTPCYKGFFDFGYTIGVGYRGEGRISMSTTHGVQIIPYLYIGAGLGFKYYHYSGSMGLPLYADIRANFLKGRITPFLDFRAGYSFLDDWGAYVSPTVGCNFGYGRKAGFSVALGYEFQKAEFYHYDYYGGGYSYTSYENCGGFVIKVGVDF